jgi:hypothetical protein
MGWAGIQNGELLRQAEELFDVPVVAQLVTAVESLLVTVQSGAVIDVPLTRSQ